MCQTRLLPFCLFLLCFSTLSAQKNAQVSFSGTIGQTKLSLNRFEERKYQSLGGQLELEMSGGKHITLGGLFAKQSFGSESVVAEPFTTSVLPPITYTINRRQTNLQFHIRYYLKESLRGFYLGGIGGFSFFKIEPSGLPERTSSYSIEPTRRDVYYALGCTYGYRIKLGNSWNASIFGSHQWSADAYAYQNNHQWGIGVNYLFKT